MFRITPKSLYAVNMVFSLFIIVRLGGEEFAVLMFDTSPATAIDVAERFRREIEEYTFSYQSYIKLKMTTSIGVYGESIVTSEKFEQFIHLADQALYLAKKTGRNKVVFITNLLLNG